MRIKIDQPYDEFRSKIGISIRKIRKTVQSPDDATRIDLNKMQIEIMGFAEGKSLIVGLYLKRFQKEDKKYYIFVITREPTINEKHVVDAYIVTEKLIPNIDELSLVQLHRNFVELFGIPINIQGKIQKFFYREVIPLKTSTKILQVPKSLDTDFIVSSFIKIVPKTKQIFCALVYSINQTMYLDRIKELSFLF